MAFDATRGRTVMYGGFRGDGDDATTSDTWEWNGSSWTQVAYGPAERAFAVMTAFPPGRVLLFGGFAEGNGFDIVYNDTWTFDGTSWQKLASGTFADPGGHETLAAVYDALRSRVVLFGGNTVDDNAAQKTYVLSATDPLALGWQEIDDQRPPARLGHAMAYAASTDEIVLFGGETLDLTVTWGDTWLFRGHVPEAIIEPGSPPVLNSAPCVANQLHVEPRTEPGPYTYRWRRRLGKVGEFVPLSDGFRLSGTETDTLHIDPTRPEDFAYYDVLVTNSCGTGHAAPVELRAVDGHFVAGSPLLEFRHTHAMAYDKSRHRMVLYGGRRFVANGPIAHAIETSNQTWEREGAGPWQFVTSTGPGRRAAPSIAYDEERHVTVLFGGFLCQESDFCLPGNPNGILYYPDTWEWDGTTWTQVLASGGPQPRAQAAMTWDPVRKRVVLVGGFNAGGFPIGDIWEWNGSAWTQRTTTGDPTIGPAGSALGLPGARNSQGLAFDTRRNVLVMHGGVLFLDANHRGGETWELAGDQWTLKAVDTVTNHGLYLPDHKAMAFDADRGSTLLFALPDGGAMAGSFGQLWEWRGAEWQAKVSPGVKWRGNAAMAYDADRKRVVMTGGVGPDDELIDTQEWEFFPSDPTCGVTACGDGVVDPGEACEPTADVAIEDCCTSQCTLRQAGSQCGSAGCNGTCTADGVCHCATSDCGDGVVGPNEQCDDGNTTDGDCCAANCTFELLNSCGPPTAHCVCAAGACLQDLTMGACIFVSATIGPAGGSLELPGSVSMTVPPGAVTQPTDFSIVRRTGSNFGVGTDATRVVSVDLQPEGVTFAVPVIVTMSWPDSAPDNGIVDGTTIDENTLRVYRNGVPLTGLCGEPLNQVPSFCGDACCEPGTGKNRWVLERTQFSEYVLDATPVACVALAKPKLSLGKILAPGGDDTIALQGELVAAGVTFDPLVRGLAFVLKDAGGTLLDVAVPPGAFTKSTKTGWKVNKKHTSWTFQRPADGTLGGIVKASVSRKGDLVKVKLAGKGGTYAATPPLAATVTFDGGVLCASSAFDVGKQACAVKNKGKAIKCK